MVERKKNMRQRERETEIVGCKTPVPIEELSGVFSLISQLQGVHYEKPLKKEIWFINSYTNSFNLHRWKFKKQKEKKCLKKKSVFTHCVSLKIPRVCTELSAVWAEIATALPWQQGSNTTELMGISAHGSYWLLLLLCREQHRVFDRGIPLETVSCPNLDMILQNI